MELINQVICGDCVQVLAGIDSPFADLIFADPPFNIGYRYHSYKDRLKSDHYVAWTKEWMAACKRVLRPHGSFYIAIGDEYAANVKLIADQLGLVMRNWIIWHYSFGQQLTRKFARAHTHILYFVNDPRHFVFNDLAIRVPSDRQLIYADKRANPLGRIPDDVWDGFPRVCGTFKARQRWHPCQMPQRLLERIIATSSNPGDCVLDPFLGSGTTAVAARLLGRRFVGIEICPQYAHRARIRLARLDRQTKGSGPLDARETMELGRLIADMAVTVRQLRTDDRLARCVARQLGVRMGRVRDYTVQEVLDALEGLR